MAFIPASVRATDVISRFSAAGLEHLHSGKTGELFVLPEPGLLLIYKTDRTSIFDFVLPALIPGKGSILTAMTILWLTRVLTTFKHHMVSYGKGIDRYLPEQLRNDSGIQQRAIVVHRRETPNIECIVREFLTGSAVQPYLATQTVCGHHLPPGLHDGSRLAEAIFTPSTKANIGHDEHIDYLAVRATHGMTPENTSLAIFREAQSYANPHKLLIADSKFELHDNEIIDEVLSPDTSRFWLMTAWERAQAANPPQSPTGFDKERLRSWGKTVITPFIDAGGQSTAGLNKLKPDNPDHVAFVSQLSVPELTLSGTSDLYHQGFEMLFEETLESFWKSA